MNFDILRSYLADKIGSKEDLPFGPDTVVYKVRDKMFCLIALIENPLRITLKCDPDLALVLRSQYEVIIPGYYMNKDHWNTLILDGTIPEEQVLEMIDESYKLVVSGLKQADRQALLELGLDEN